jgi:benzoyl-CoA 2,3-dioxygenase component A
MIATYASLRNIGAWPTPGISAIVFGPRQPKQYVQDLIRARHDAVWRQLNDADCYIYLCGLKGMEKGVDEAFRDVCRQHGGDWDTLLPQLREKSRYHIETY